jgi:hypothetical protein
MDGRLTVTYIDEITEKERSSDKNYGRGVIIMDSVYLRPTKNTFKIYLSFVAKKRCTDIHLLFFLCSWFILVSLA